MNIKFIVNEYLLAWYLLYGASLSKEIDKFRKELWSKYKLEYNFCYKDKTEMIKYGKDFIPDNDIIYNEIFRSDLYKSLKKETEKYRIQLEKNFVNSLKKIKKSFQEVLKVPLKDEYTFYIVHPRMECMEYNNQVNALVWGSDKSKYDALILTLATIIKGMYKDYYEKNKEITSSVLELAIYGEISKKITDKETINLEDKTLMLIKRQIYPFWLMYLGYDTKETLLNKMIEDRIAFDIENYPIDKKMKKMNIQEFIDFCIKNNRHILKLGNVLKIEENEEIEII